MNWPNSIPHELGETTKHRFSKNQLVASMFEAPASVAVRTFFPTEDLNGCSLNISILIPAKSEHRASITAVKNLDKWLRTLLLNLHSMADNALVATRNLECRPLDLLLLFLGAMIHRS